MVMLTRKQPVVLKLDLYSFLIRPSPNDSERPTLWASFRVNLCPIAKSKHIVAKAFSLAKRGGLVGENAKRTNSVTVVRN